MTRRKKEMGDKETQVILNREVCLNIRYQCVPSPSGMKTNQVLLKLTW
jgi:hypothetical protein